MKGKSEIREWLYNNYEFIIEDLKNNESPETLWKWFKRAMVSSYAKGRRTGIKYTIKKYIKKDER